jgi:hypothetical protein
LGSFDVDTTPEGIEKFDVWRLGLAVGHVSDGDMLLPHDRRSLEEVCRRLADRGELRRVGDGWFTVAS